MDPELRNSPTETTQPCSEAVWQSHESVQQDANIARVTCVDTACIRSDIGMVTKQMPTKR